MQKNHPAFGRDDALRGGPRSRRQPPCLLEEEELVAEPGAGLPVQDLAGEEGQFVGVLAWAGDPHGARPVPVEVTQLEREPGDSERRGKGGS